MKIIAALSVLFICLNSFAGGLAFQIEGRLIQKNKDYVVLETENTRYKIKIPESKKEVFNLKKIKKQKYFLNASTLLMVSKNLIENPKGVK